MKGIKRIALTTMVVSAISSTQYSYSGPNAAPLSNPSSNNGGQKVTIQRAQRGVPARLIDQDDYYFRPDGSKVTLYRKKDVYVVRKKSNTNTAADTMQRFKGQYGYV